MYIIKSRSLEKHRNKKSTPSGVNSMRSQVLYWAAQGAEVYCMLEEHMTTGNSPMLPSAALLSL